MMRWAGNNRQWNERKEGGGGEGRRQQGGCYWVVVDGARDRINGYKEREGDAGESKQA